MNCGATDEVPGGWGRLAFPCPNAPKKTPEVCLEVTEKLPSLSDFITDAIYEETKHGSYDCLRVWEAWSVGTMGADDFVELCERSDEIAVSIMKKIAEHPAIKRALAIEAALAEFPPLARKHGTESLSPIEDWYREHIVPIRELPSLKENFDAA